MGQTLVHGQSHMGRDLRDTTASKAVLVGLAGGLAGTFAMDLFGVGIFLVMGKPVNLSSTIIGDSAAAFLSAFGISVTGGAPLGAALYYLIGLALGGMFGAAVSRVDAQHANHAKRQIGLSILFVEVVSVPMLATGAIVLRLTAPQTAQWFGISFVMHLVYGLVLGAIVTYKRPAGR